MKKVKTIVALFMAASILASCACSKSETSKEKKKQKKTTTTEEQSVPEETISEMTDPSEEAGSLSETENSSSDGTTASSETETTTTKVSKDKICISDGPICCKTIDHVQIYYQLSLETGEEYPFFKVPAQYEKNTCFALGYRQFIVPQIFDPTYERIVAWVSDDETKESHVGWIDRNGVFTDVTAIVHPQSDDFGNITPVDVVPHFDSKGNLVYFDSNENAIVYFDEATQSEVTIQDLDDKSINRQYLWNGAYTTVSVASDFMLDYDDQINHPDILRFRDDVIIYKRLVEDYFEHDGGYTFFVLGGGAIYHGGTGITATSELEENGEIKKEYDVTSILIDDCRITPESEWYINAMYYLDGMVYFKAYKGEEDAWFKMPYSDGVAGSPVKIEDEEESEKAESYYYHFFRWDFRDIEVPVIG